MILKTWGDPDVFRPERFMSPNGKLTKRDQFIPFGIGKDYYCFLAFKLASN
jgi:cytochrome P450